MAAAYATIKKAFSRYSPMGAGVALAATSDFKTVERFGLVLAPNNPPIETEEGWLVLYHGVKSFPAGPAYRMGAALLDLEDPRHLILRLPYWILGAQEQYEMAGEVPNVIFSCGHVQKGDDLYIYYGAADSSVCLATGRISALLEALKKNRP